MEIARNNTELKEKLDRLPKPIGFVPTMGYLHEGHLSLVKAAASECASVVVSIFVNPTQFGPTEDLAKYPRDLEKDFSLLNTVKCDLVYVPTAEQMYPQDFQTWVSVDTVTQKLEGALRPGHFRGVSTVVLKLFNLIQPQKAFFGQKDAQQVIVIKQMVKDLNVPVEVVVCPICRELDGLAMSSRNVYLNPDERKAAPILQKALQKARFAFESGERSAEKLKEIVLAEISTESIPNVQYVSVADRDTLEELTQVEHGALISLAAYFGKTRLIDNLLIKN
ncbi:MAG: pantoate--beta-alanine ligase [Anaerolineaceae bacterium]|nr:pantoate--beta-alanine ligase [Anaerolineaceae bacterium]